jgi:hypothetical protein
MFPISRIIALLMAGVLCFAFLVPMSLAFHHPTLAYFVGLVFVAYLVANIFLWLRTRPRA